MPAREVIARLDEGGPPVFSRLAREHLGRSEFPALGAAYAALGLTREDSGVRLEGDAEARRLREAIMAPGRAMAPVPDCGR